MGIGGKVDLALALGIGFLRQKQRVSTVLVYNYA